MRPERTAEASLAADPPLGGMFGIAGRIAVGEAALAAGDLAAVHEMREATGQAEGVILGITWAALHVWNVEAALADGDLPAARGCAEDAILATKGTKGHYEVAALLNRARVAIATGEVEPAERDARDALALAAAIKVTRCSFPRSSSASPFSPARAAVTAKPPASSAPQRPSGCASARCGSRSVTPATKPR